jgi:serine/threonine-protein kinase
MERFGDRYLVGDALDGTSNEQIFTGAVVAADGGPATEVALEFADRRLATTPGAVDQLRELVSRMEGVGGPNLAAVYDLVTDGPRIALVMEPLPPTTLRDWLLGHGALLPAHVAQLGAEIAGALRQIHDRGVLHLRLTPENVRMDGISAKVTGQCLGSVRLSSGPHIRDAAISAMSRYAAPELIRGEPLGPGTDMYALGMVLYEACCGVPPFVGALPEVFQAHLECRPGVLKDVPSALRSVIEELVVKDPAARPDAQSTSLRLADLATQLGGLPAASPRREPPVPVLIPPVGVPDMARRRRGKFLVGAALVAAVAVPVTFFVMTSDPSQGSSGGSAAGGVQGGGPSGSVSGTPTTTTEAITRMPDLVGLELSVARTRLPADLDIETVLVAGNEDEDGVVKAQEPAQGEPIGGTVKLTVARPLVPIQLDSLEPVEGQWGSTPGTGVVMMSGDQYLHSLSSSASACSSSSEVGYVEYNLARAYTKFRADVGLADGSENDKLKVLLEVIADDRPVGRAEIEYGKPVSLDIDMTEVLRLRIQWQVTSTYEEAGCNSALVTLGDPRLDGFAEQIATSGAPSTPGTTGPYPTPTS